MKLPSICIICILTLTIFSNVAGQAFISEDKDTLAGIKVMKVVVENSTSVSETESLKENQIKTDIELKLKKAGIKIEDSPLLPFLYINFKTLKNQNPPLLNYSLNIEFNQVVFLENKSKSVIASTWGREKNGTSAALDSQQIRQNVSDLVDQFISDYIAANASATVRQFPPSPSFRKNEVAVMKQYSSKTDTVSYDKYQYKPSTFIPYYIGGKQPPQIVVKNTSDRTLNFEFGEKKMVISSGQKQVINTTDNRKHSFIISAAGIIPFTGAETFQQGYIYTWELSIETDK
jgi:hypothetical protein